MKSRCDAPAWASVFFGQQEGGHAAVGLGDDPERVVAKSLARHRIVNVVCGQDAIPRLQGLVIGLPIFLAHATPITAHMAVEATVKQGHVPYAYGAVGRHHLPKQEKRTDRLFPSNWLL
jgi:hypothetical protein